MSYISYELQATKLQVVARLCRMALVACNSQLLTTMADKELTFWDHLDELRRVLFRVLGVWFVLAVGYFIAMPWLFDNVVLAPCHNDFVFYDVLRYVG